LICTLFGILLDHRAFVKLRAVKESTAVFAPPRIGYRGYVHNKTMSLLGFLYRPMWWLYLMNLLIMLKKP